MYMHMVLVMFYSCLTRDTWIIMREKKKESIIKRSLKDTAVHIIIFLSVRD